MILKKKKIRINNFLVKIFHSIKNIFAVLFLIQFLILSSIIFWYFSSSVNLRHDPEKIISFINEKTKNVIGFEINKSDDYLKIYTKSILLKLLPNKFENININIGQKEIIEIEFQRQNRSDKYNLSIQERKRLQKFVNGTLTINQRTIPIKLRVKGDRNLHFKDFKNTSYKIDLRRDNKLWGLEEFSLQKPIIRNYAYEYLFHKLNSELKNISLEYNLVNLSVNGLDHGIFVIEEGFSKELIERHGKRNGPIYRAIDETSFKYKNSVYEAHSELYWAINEPEILKAGYSILNGIKNEEIDYKNFINWDAWAKYFAISDLLETYHGAIPRNVKIYYDPVTAKIEPISFDGHNGTAKFDNFILLNFINERSNCKWICDQRDWFLRFILDENKNPRDEFLLPYLKYLNQITNKKFIDNFLNKHKDKINEMNNAFYSEFSKSDQIFWKGWVPYIYDDEYLYKRSEEIKKRLNESKLSNIYISMKNDKVFIDPTINQNPIRIKFICKNNKSENEITNQWVSNKTVIKNTNKCQFLRVENLQGHYKDVYLFDNPVLDRKNVPKDFEMFEKFHKKIPGKIVDGTFIPSENLIKIDENLVLPKNVNLKINGNHKIIIGNESSLIFLGNVDIIGDNNNPIIIQGDQINPGNLISLNNTITIKNTIFSNLKTPTINGYKLFAGFNIINSEVKIYNAKFKKFSGEDMLNLINSNSELKNVDFTDASSDALDVDSGNIYISNFNCFNISNDCIDVSNSKVKGGNININSVFDKSLSIGEKSKAEIENIRINNSEIGIAVKDQSEVYLKNVEIKNSTLPIAVFVKKQEYGPAKLIAENLNLNKSNKIFLVDKISQVTINNENVKGELTGKKIESLLYGNTFGRETVR